MKKLHLALLAFFFMLAANAQKINEKDLLGQWKIVSYTDPEMHLDFTTDVSKITDKMVMLNPGYTITQLEEMAKDRLDYLRESYLIFAPNSIFFMTNNNEEPAYFKYALITKGGAQYLSYDETGNTEEIYIKDGLLYRTLGESESQIIEAYKKEKL